jgi:Protein of unknown function (DUF2948)
MGERLRLKAVDRDDLSVIAACLQDALIPLAEMAYLAEERRFVAAFTRFRRECLADPTSRDGMTQCQSALVFNQVEAVQHCGLDSRFGAVRLELLTLVAAPGQGGLIDITLLFAGDMAIRLQVRELAATLEDFGEPWPATVAPAHELAGAPAEGG